MGSQTQIKLALEHALYSSLCMAQIIAESKRVLREGGIAILPTETSYMLAANALSSSAVNRVRKLKQRPATMQMSVAFHSVEFAKKWTVWPEYAISIGALYLPGPLTIVLLKKTDARLVKAATGPTLGVRVPGLKLLRNILQDLDFPVTATSANPHGATEPYSINECIKQADFIWDAGNLLPAPPSTIVDCSKKEMNIIRPGNISESDLRAAKKI